MKTLKMKPTMGVKIRMFGSGEGVMQKAFASLMKKSGMDEDQINDLAEVQTKMLSEGKLDVEKLDSSGVVDIDLVHFVTEGLNNDLRKQEKLLSAAGEEVDVEYFSESDITQAFEGLPWNEALQTLLKWHSKQQRKMHMKLAESHPEIDESDIEGEI